MKVPHDLEHITVAIETITPTKARAYLLSNRPGNRPISTTTVRAYVVAMQTDRWPFTGESLIFDRNGNLINGQHRLKAVEISGIPLISVVVRGVPVEAFDLIDNLRARTHADVLAGHGFADQQILAAATKLVLAHRAGHILNPAETKAIASKPAVLAEVQRAPELWDAATRAARATAPFTPSSIAAFFMLTIEDAGWDVATVTEFLAAIESGAGLTKGAPQLAVRNWRMRATRPTNLETLANLITAWNAHVATRPLDHLKSWYRGRAFPKITTSPTALEDAS